MSQRRKRKLVQTKKLKKKRNMIGKSLNQMRKMMLQIIKLLRKIQKPKMEVLENRNLLINLRKFLVVLDPLLILKMISERKLFVQILISMVKKMMSRLKLIEKKDEIFKKKVIMIFYSILSYLETY